MVSFIPGLVGGVKGGKNRNVWSCADIINLCSMRGSPSGYICCARLLPEHEILYPDKWKTCLHCAVLSHVNSNESLSVVIDNE
jgi:hypothetical protein